MSCLTSLCLPLNNRCQPMPFFPKTLFYVSHLAVTIPVELMFVSAVVPEVKIPFFPGSFPFGTEPIVEKITLHSLWCYLCHNKVPLMCGFVSGLCFVPLVCLPLFVSVQY